MEVLGRDTAREVYLVQVEAGGRRLKGAVPEHLIDLKPGPRHQDAYDWLAAHSRAVTEALAARAEGRQPPAPYSDIALAEEL